MPMDVAQTTRGAFAGAVAAGVWAAQQPVDKRVFGVPYDDTELLGKAVTRGRAWPVAGLAIHLANGAAFGAAYSLTARTMPLPSWARGPVAALGEHLLTWPLMAVSERIHPARDELPRIARDPRAFLQSAWRHLVFGIVLGELERRLNAPPDPEVPTYEHVVSSNGHGNLEAAMAGPGL